MDPLASFLLSTATFLLGLLVGNRLAIGRDKRKEFNEIIAPIRSMLLAEKDQPIPHDRYIEQTTIDLLATYYWWFKRKRFLATCRRYKKARNDPQNIYKDDTGQDFYKSTEELKSVIDELLVTYLKFRK